MPRVVQGARQLFALLAVVAYVPLLLTHPGRVVADTKTYLYLDPGRLLARAVSIMNRHEEVALAYGRALMAPDLTTLPDVDAADIDLDEIFLIRDAA